MNELTRFAKQWSHPNYGPDQVLQSDLNACEQALNILFPSDYRFQILEVGLPKPTLALLTAIVDIGLDLNDLSELNAPAEIIVETADWRDIGMPENFVIIGTDSLGSKFCFDARDLEDGRVAQSPVYFWDHDYRNSVKVADSFASWIESYLGDWSKGISFSDF